MAITPEGLLDLAVALSSMDGEPAQRRCVSTAYYAAFHAARRRFGVTSGGGREHQIVGTRLSEYDRHAGYVLEALRTARRNADYAIDDAFETDSRVSCEHARQVIDAVSGGRVAP